jgi:hypothetical protein
MFLLILRTYRRWDLQNLPDLFGSCKSFDFLFAKHDASCLKKGAQPVSVPPYVTLYSVSFAHHCI